MSQHNPSLIELHQQARKVRESIVDMVYRAGGGHAGSALSQVEILVALYYRCMNLSAAAAQDEQRDRFVLSKGHGGIGLLPILADLGFIPQSELKQFAEPGSRLGMHMNHLQVPGLEVSTGSLGHGLGMACGIALGLQLQNNPAWTYCLISDGECYEGSTWEAFLAAPGLNIQRLVVVIDRNRLTMDGDTESELPLEPLAEKLEAFGWQTQSVDGHDLQQLHNYFDRIRQQDQQGPFALIAHTVKGKAVDFMENQAAWHYGSLDSASHQAARDSIQRYYKKILN